MMMAEAVAEMAYAAVTQAAAIPCVADAEVVAADGPLKGCVACWLEVLVLELAAAAEGT